MKQNSITQQILSHHQELIHARIKMQGDQSHHLELVCEQNGVSWINNSIATTIDMTWLALRDVSGPVILIIGGVDRSEDQHKLKMLVKEKVKTVICLGSTPWKYFNAYHDYTNTIINASDLDDAVDYAKAMSPDKIKTVLFSPSCPSYDAFDNYKNRGNAFRDTVLEKIISGKKKRKK